MLQPLARLHTPSMSVLPSITLCSAASELKLKERDRNQILPPPPGWVQEPYLRTMESAGTDSFSLILSASVAYEEPRGTKTAKVNVNRTLTTQQLPAGCESWNSRAEISAATLLTHRLHKLTQQFSAHLHLCVSSAVTTGSTSLEVYKTNQ